MKTDIPPPDKESIPAFIRESVEDILFSTNNLFRAVITSDEQKMFRVHRDYWCVSDYEYICEGYWCQCDQMNTMTDSLESAREFAKQKLRETSDGCETNSEDIPPNDR